jgi:hypothetical protein
VSVLRIAADTADDALLDKALRLLADQSETLLLVDFFGENLDRRLRGLRGLVDRLNRHGEVWMVRQPTGGSVGIDAVPEATLEPRPGQVSLSSMRDNATSGVWLAVIPRSSLARVASVIDQWPVG